jgi:hypothetical protein
MVVVAPVVAAIARGKSSDVTIRGEKSPVFNEGRALCSNGQLRQIKP